MAVSGVHLVFIYSLPYHFKLVEEDKKKKRQFKKITIKLFYVLPVSKDCAALKYVNVRM